jgi:hypothetical protein
LRRYVRSVGTYSRSDRESKAGTEIPTGASSIAEINQTFPGEKRGMDMHRHRSLRRNLRAPPCRRRRPGDEKTGAGEAQRQKERPGRIRGPPKAGGPRVD